jgi:hypothetical protein
LRDDAKANAGFTLRGDRIREADYINAPFEQPPRK